jgi:hypothetical protein
MKVEYSLDGNNKLSYSIDHICPTCNFSSILPFQFRGATPTPSKVSIHIDRIYYNSLYTRLTCHGNPSQCPHLHLFSTTSCVIIVKALRLTQFKKRSKYNIAVGSKWDNRSHSRHRRKCLLDCFGGQLDANTKISTGYAQNLPNHWD